MFQMFNVLSFSFPRVRDFVKTRGQYELMRLNYRWALGPFEVSHIVPEDEAISIYPQDWDLQRIMARYLLYPRQVVDQGGYVIDMLQELKQIPESWQKKQLVSGGVVYAKDGHSFENVKKTPQSFVKVMIVIICVSLLNVMVGLFILSLLNIRVNQGGLFWFLGLSYLLGFLILTLNLWFALMAGIKLSFYKVILIWGAVLGFLMLKAHQRIKDVFCQLKDEVRNSSIIFRQHVFTNFAILLLIFLLFLSIFVSPVVDWDSMFHWMLQSKILFHQSTFGSLYPDLSYYPILWPLNVAAQYFIFGTDYDAIASCTSGLFFLVFVSQFLGCLKILRIKRKWLLMPVLFFLTYFFEDSFFYYKNADPLFLCFMTALVSVVLLCENDQFKVKRWNLFFLLALGLCSVKLEGFIASLIVGFCVFWVNRLNWSLKDIGKLIICFTMPIFVLIVWRVWVNYFGFYIPISHFESGVDFEKLFLYGSLISKRILQLDFKQFCLLSILLLSYIFGKRYSNVSVRFLGTLFFLYAAFSCVSVIGVYDNRLEDQLIWATPRVFFHITPVLILWWAALTLEREKV